MSHIYPQRVRLQAEMLRAAGHSDGAIARELGVPRSTVQRWFDPDCLTKQRERFKRYSGTCVDCGARTSGCNGREKAPERCYPCTTAFLKTWTREAIIAAIRLFVHRYGRIPSAVDWNTTYARNAGHPELAERFYADGDYPQTGIVQREFGSWNAGIAAAGFTPRGIGKRGHSQRPRRASA